MKALEFHKQTKIGTMCQPLHATKGPCRYSMLVECYSKCQVGLEYSQLFENEEANACHNLKPCSKAMPIPPEHAHPKSEGHNFNLKLFHCTKLKHSLTRPQQHSSYGSIFKLHTAASSVTKFLARGATKTSLYPLLKSAWCRQAAIFNEMTFRKSAFGGGFFKLHINVL